MNHNISRILYQLSAVSTNFITANNPDSECEMELDYLFTLLTAITELLYTSNTPQSENTWVEFTSIATNMLNLILQWAQSEEILFGGSYWRLTRSIIILLTNLSSTKYL